MARPHVQVRDAVPDDVADLVAMWGEARETTTGRTDRILPQASDAAALSMLRSVSEDPSTRVLVATLDTKVVGLAVLTRSACLPLLAVQSVQLHYLHVRPHARRRGVGRSLVAAAAAWAEECGADQVITNVPPGERETNRFLARLGFGQMAVRRSAPAAALRRRLTPDPRAVIVDDVARRRLRRVRGAVARTGLR